MISAKQAKNAKDAKEFGLSEKVIGCAIEVHRELGPGFLESVYENALAVELRASGISVNTQRPLKVRYKGQVVGSFVADLTVEDEILLELKAARKLGSDHEAQILNYLKATSINVGLLLNFGTTRLEIKRIVWKHDDARRI